ncbi:MAG: glycosyltransferase family 4 protein [Candidatus Binataceae bacterium]|jgi:glycosyltransferase involved in cell wall biosynthesis
MVEESIGTAAPHTSAPDIAADGLPVLRVAGVDPERRFAGGESQVLGLTLALVNAGHRAELLCDPAGQLWHRANTAGIQCRPLPIRNSIDAMAGLRLRRLVAEHRYDIVHFHTSRAHALAPWIIGRGRSGTARAVVTRRMDYVPNRLFAPWLYNRAVSGVAAIAPAVADALVRAGVDRRRIALVPSGVDCVRFAPPDPAVRRAARKALGLTCDRVAVGTVGMLEERKGHRYLIGAIASARSQEAGVPDLRCLIVGEGSLLAELANQITALEAAGLPSETIRLLGPCDDPYPILAALDIFVMPSLAEGLGVAALEAMACGLPVIASAAGGLRDLVEHQVNGLLVPPGDTPALAQSIVELAADRELRTLMGSAGRARVAADFSMEAMARRTLALYRDCLGHQL